MMLIIDVEGRAGVGAPAVDAPVVVVEPLLGGPAVVLAVEHEGALEISSGSGVVPHLGALLDGGVAGQPARVDDLVDALRAEQSIGAREAIIVSHLNLRPCAAMLGSWLSHEAQLQRVRIACAVTTAGDVAADAMQLAGALARMLLDEVTRPVMLSESAGMAMTIAESYPDPLGALESGRRWGSIRGMDGVDATTPQAAATTDQCAAVPVVSLDVSQLRAVAWGGGGS